RTGSVLAGELTAHLDCFAALRALKVDGLRLRRCGSGFAFVERSRGERLDVLSRGGGRRLRDDYDFLAPGAGGFLARQRIVLDGQRARAVGAVELEGHAMLAGDDRGEGTRAFIMKGARERGKESV